MRKNINVFFLFIYFIMSLWFYCNIEILNGELLLALSLILFFYLAFRLGRNFIKLKILEMQKRILNIYYNIYCINILYMISKVWIFQMFMRNDLMVSFTSIKALLAQLKNLKKSISEYLIMILLNSFQFFTLKIWFMWRAFFAKKWKKLKRIYN